MISIYIREETVDKTVDKVDGGAAARKRDPEDSDKVTAPQVVRKLATYGSMAVLANRVAAGTRQALKKHGEGPPDSQAMEQKIAAAALGAEQTEKQLLRANRYDIGEMLYAVAARQSANPLQSVVLRHVCIPRPRNTHERKVLEHARKEGVRRLTPAVC